MLLDKLVEGLQRPTAQKRLMRQSGDIRMSIGKDWQEVERWLKAHAPKVLARLPKGASETDLAYVEKTWRLSLPQELRESLTIHDGNARAFGLYGPNQSTLGELLSLHEIVLAWRSLKSLAGPRAESVKGVKKLWWHRKWLPVLGGFGDHTCIDLDPARGGKLGQVFLWAHDGGPIKVVAPTYGDLFARFVQELKDGHYRYLKTSPWGHARLDRKKPAVPKEWQRRVRLRGNPAFALPTERVQRSRKGEWTFLPFWPKEGAYTVVTLASLVERDPTLKPVLDLQPGWEAVRKKFSAPWVRRRLRTD